MPHSVNQLAALTPKRTTPTQEMMSPATWVFMYLIGPMFLLAEALSFVTRIVCFVQYVTKQVCTITIDRGAFRG